LINLQNNYNWIWHFTTKKIELRELRERMMQWNDTIPLLKLHCRWYVASYHEFMCIYSSRRVAQYYSILGVSPPRQAISVLWRALVRCTSEERLNYLEIGDKSEPSKMHQSTRVQCSARVRRAGSGKAHHHLISLSPCRCREKCWKLKFVVRKWVEVEFWSFPRMRPRELSLLASPSIN
jgi:hypothetical protein